MDNTPPLPALISCHDVTKTYIMGTQKVHALRGVDLTFNRGEMTAIMGPSGSGKSTLMNLIGALDVPTSGELAINGKNLAKLRPNDLADLRNETIGFVFQQFNLLGRSSALTNVKLPLRYSRKPVADINARAAECLEMVGLGDRMDHRPMQLSGGQQQRVAIARALAGSPSIILADEPTGALDTKTSADIMALLTELSESGITVILVTHEADVAEYAARKVHFRDGQVELDERPAS
jgi:putative ABC transport system ATP-binding protein